MDSQTRAWNAGDGASYMITPGEWDEIDRLFDEASDLPEADQPAFLDAACAGRPLVRRQIELLLVASQEAGDDFLAPLPHRLDGNALRPFLGEEQLLPGQRVGAYEIVGPIGRGGMGIVYRAERAFGRFKKPVALKVVKRGMDTEDIVHRFRYERQILAGLEHAHIARLLDGGVTDDGLPYFVMEFVEGRPIDQYCDEKRLGVRERVALFRAVCEAVAYAHRNLVVHRDLKPGNVLVSGDGDVKLLDFGIAKVLVPDTPGATVPITEATDRRMTPEYAAPEQVRGEPVTTATDVYALGVILYELLSGHRPYRFSSRLLTEIEEKICNEVPGRPSTAVFRTEANDASPEAIGRQRGASPQRLRREIAGDLDAITMMALKKEPELRYASAGELARDLGRYLDRRPVRAARDTVVYRLRKFVQRYQTTVAAVAFGLFALVAGTASTWWQSYEKRQEAKRVAEEVMRKNAMVNFISNIMVKVDPESGEGSTFTALEILEAGLKDIQGLADQPEVQADLFNEFGRLGASANLVDLADSLHRAAYTIQSRTLGENHPSMAVTLTRMADVYAKKGDTLQAERAFLHALRLNESYHPAHNNLGLFYLDRNRLDEGHRELRRAIALKPNEAKYWNNLGDYYFRRGEIDSAAVAFRQAIRIEPYYVAFTNLGTIEYFLQRYEEAARMYEQALRIKDKDYVIWGYLGTALYLVGPERRYDANRALRRASSLALEKLAVVNDRDPVILGQMATYHAMLGEAPATLHYLNEVAFLHSENPYVFYDMGYSYELIGRRDNAIHWIHRAIDAGYPIGNLQSDPAMASLIQDAAFTSALSNGAE
jgi:serine/threonine-protein kinase